MKRIKWNNNLVRELNRAFLGQKTSTRCRSSKSLLHNRRRGTRDSFAEKDYNPLAKYQESADLGRLYDYDSRVFVNKKMKAGGSGDLRNVVKLDKSFLDELKDKATLKQKNSNDEKFNSQNLKNLIKSKKKIVDYDAPHLDLSKSNKQLFDEIRKNASQSRDLKYNNPSKKWSNSFSNQELKQMKKLFNSIPVDATVSGKLITDALQVGDLVAIGQELLKLYIVAKVPESFASAIVTLLSDRGDVLFVHTSTICLRIPGAVPTSLRPMLRQFVELETKHLDSMPIGVPDAKFSKSKEALPTDLQAEYVSIEASAELDEEAEYEPQNLLVTQASSQLLTNTAVQTFLVPEPAREMYYRALTQVSSDAFSMIEEFNTKLEKLHRSLQFDMTSELNAPRSISIFELLSRVEDVEKQNQNPSATTSLALSPAKMVDYDKISFPIAKYMAIVFVLKKQSRLWTIQKSSQTPTRVTIWPLAQIVHEDLILQYLNNKGGIAEIAKYCVEKIAQVDSMHQTSLSSLPPPPPQFENIKNILKAYVIGKYENNPGVSSTVISLLRAIDDGLYKKTGVSQIEDAYKFEYSSGKAYDLLTKLDNDIISNPNNWFPEAKLPSEELTLKSSSQEEYLRYFDDAYNSINRDILMDKCLSENLFANDPLAKIRVDMTEVPVYCIDDASAHEIDDGISIHEEKGEYVISTHIAEPSSFIKPDSPLSSIALERASTTYFPENVVPMFPKAIADLAGLGVNGKETRTFVIQYRLKKEDIDFFIEQSERDAMYIPEPTFLERVKQQAELSAKVRFALTKRYPQGFTYDAVENLLNSGGIFGASNLGNGRNSGVSLSATRTDFQNLNKLSKISKLFWLHRKLKNAYVGTGNARISIKQTMAEDKDLLIDGSNLIRMKLPNSTNSISFVKDKKKTSVQLVTENMIMANYLVANIADKLGIDILYKFLDPKYEKNLLNEYNDLLRKASQNGDIPMQKKLDLFLLFPKTFILATPQMHFPMALSMYSNITSPLRRYIDIINQWKFQEYLLKTEMVSKTSVDAVISHLNSRGEIQKRLQKSTEGFWQALMLKVFIQQYSSQENMAKDLNLTLCLRHNPASSQMVSLVHDLFTFVRMHLEVSNALLQDIKSGRVQVGDPLDPTRLVCKKLDIIENELIFEYK